MSSAQVGISQFDFTDPDVVNVESQAYPFPEPELQQLPQQLGALIAGSLFAGRFAMNPPQALPVPTEVDVGRQSFRFPLSLGIASPFFSEIDLKAQNVTRQPVADFLVTECGNFRTNASNPEIARRTVLSVVTRQVLVTGGTLTQYQVFFVPGTNLFEFGVDLVGTAALFPNSAPANWPQDVPPGAIISFSTNWILVDGTYLTGDPPAMGDVVDLDISRIGDDLVFDVFSNTREVFVSTSTPPPVALTTIADSFGEIEAFAGSGVLTPFIGSGVRVPRLLGTFFVERNDVDASSSPPVIDSYQ